MSEKGPQLYNMYPNPEKKNAVNKNDKHDKPKSTILPPYTREEALKEHPLLNKYNNDRGQQNIVYPYNKRAEDIGAKKRKKLPQEFPIDFRGNKLH